MEIPRTWEHLYPEAVRGYRPDPATLPARTDEIGAAIAREFPQRVAFTLALADGTSAGLTYGEVDSLSNAFAAYLVHDLRLAPGEVIALHLPNSLHYPIALFGAWRAGLIVTNVNPLYTEREMRHQLTDSGAKAVVTLAGTPARVAAAASDGTCVLIEAALTDELRADAGSDAHAAGPDGSARRFTAALAAGRTLPAADRAPHPVALYQYTGGTTGRSKGAVITHRNVLSALEPVYESFSACGVAPGRDDVVLTALPLYHVFALVINLLLFYRSGSRNVLVPSPRPVANLRPAFEHHPITWMTGVETLYAGLLAEGWFRKGQRQLRWALSGGAALRRSTAEAWERAVCPILEGYGMTETSCIVSLSLPSLPSRAGSVGLPTPGTEVRIVDGEGYDTAAGQPGELLVRGPQVIRQYLNQPEETARSLVDGWLHTGDIARLDDDGRLYIVDRKKDMVLVSGFNVYPNEIEGVLALHPEIAEAAVLGVPDGNTGEAVRAFVVARVKDLGADEVVRFCATQLAPYKVPKQVVFLEQLPKSPVGKVLRSQLRDKS